MSSGGGGSQTPTNQTVTQTNIPAYAQPYVESMLGKASALTGQPYQPYGGQQVAGFNPLQRRSFDNISSMTPSAYTGQSANLAGEAGTSSFTGDTVNRYMSPYINDVINQQQQGAIRDYGRSLPNMAGVATQSGNLGSSREALVNSEAQRNLQNTLSGIRSSGLQAGYMAGQGQFNAENANKMAAAGILGSAGQADYGQRMGINSAMMGAGNQMQGLEQNIYNKDYQNYMNEVNYPYQNLGFLSSLIHGLPIQQFGTTTYAAPPSTATMGLGLGSAALTAMLGGNSGGQPG
jgi:hypothetical protein